MKCVAPLLCYFLPKNIISNLFELFFSAKNTAYSPVHHATSQRTRSLQLSPQSNAPLSPLLNTYAKTPPTSFRAGCAGNRSMESPSACHRMRHTPPPIPMLFLPKILFQIYLNYFFSKKTLPIPPCTTPQANAHDPSNCPLNQMRRNTPLLCYFYPKILFQIYLNYFFQQKNHIPTTEFPTLVHYYTGGMTIYQVTQISGYTKNAPLP